MRISINQPYFIPYAGYFRLFTGVDLHVIYDDAQFPYPGYVHRNRLKKRNGDEAWFTLPLAKAPLNTKIKDMRFALNVKAKWQDTYPRFQVFRGSQLNMLTQVVLKSAYMDKPLKAITTTLTFTQDALNLHVPVIYASSLKIDPAIKGQDRVLAICEQLRADEYVNASGGKKLYDPAEFEHRGIKLKILKPYEGSKVSILERLAYEKPQEVRKEIEDNVEFIS